MELQFEKKVIPCLQTLARDVQTQEQTQEVRLPDGMPDIGNIVTCRGQLLVRGKEWRSGGIGVSGGVMAWVLYEPEDGGELQCVETWLPLQMKWDITDSDHDGSICVSPLLRCVDARAVSARKIMVRTGVSILAEAMVSAEMEVYQPGELADDICLLKNNYPVLLPVEAGEKAFSLEETLALPTSAAPIQKILYYFLRTEMIDQKIISDKAVFRGSAVLHLLYCSQDNELHSMDFDVPFSQYAQLDREYEPESLLDVSMAVTNLELEQSGEENLIIKAGLTGQYVVHDNTLIEIVEDAYSPMRNVSPEIDRLNLPAVLDRVEQTVDVQQTADLDGVQIIDSVFYPEHPRTYHEDGKAVAELSGVFHLLYCDENGHPGSLMSRWEGDWKLPAASETNIQMHLVPTGKTQVTLGSGNATMHADIHVKSMITQGRGIPMVTGMDISEQIPLNANRPSLILRRAGEDTLWKIAKEAGSTVDMIRNANNITQEPDTEQMLLIPVL